MRPLPVFVVLACIAAAAFAASWTHAVYGIRVLMNEAAEATEYERAVGYVRATERSCTRAPSEHTKANPDCARLLNVSGDLAARPDDQYLWVELVRAGLPGRSLWAHNPLKFAYRRIPRLAPAVSVFGHRYEIGQDVLLLFRPGQSGLPHVPLSEEADESAWASIRWGLLYGLIAALAIYGTCRIHRKHPDVLEDPAPEAAAARHRKAV